MSSCKRRIFIKQSIYLTIGILTSFINVKSGCASTMAGYFKDETFSNTIERLFNHRTITNSDQIKLSLPEIAENVHTPAVTIVAA